MDLQETDITVGGKRFRIAFARDFPESSGEWYWASLWPSALALSEQLLHKAPLTGMRILELGCGCGLAGIVAGTLGGSVTVSDIKTEALELAGQNWARNGVTPEDLLQLDWQSPPSLEGFDLILGADIAYDENLFPGLLETFRKLLTPSGTIMVAEPGRPQAHGFFARMLSAGYKVETSHVDVPMHGTTFSIGVSTFV